MQLPYTYIDVATLTIDNTTGTWQIGVWDDSEGASINAPTGPDAVALARAVLAAAGETGHRVVSKEHIKDLEAAAAYVAARSMRDRAAQEVLFQPGARVPMAVSEAIAALPLLTADNTKETP